MMMKGLQVWRVWAGRGEFPSDTLGWRPPKGGIKQEGQVGERSVAVQWHENGL